MGKRIELEIPEDLIEKMRRSEKVRDLLEAHDTQDLEEELNLIVTEALREYLV